MSSVLLDNRPNRGFLSVRGVRGDATAKRRINKDEQNIEKKRIDMAKI